MATPAVKWNEAAIARALTRSTFKGDLCVVDNCQWTGHECDLLVVTRNMHVIDVEIKISRADLKADKDKAKWWHRGFSHWADGKYVEAPRVALPYPTRVWKHYYAMPKELWCDDLLKHVHKNSGVLLLSPPKNCGERAGIDCVKRPIPNRNAYRLTMFDLVDVARLASLRMWDAYNRIEADREDYSKRLALQQLGEKTAVDAGGNDNAAGDVAHFNS